MKHNPELIVMLTYNDKTVENAHEIFNSSRYSKAKFWGIKEEGLPPEQMETLYTDMKKHGKNTVLEVVAYTEEECIRGAEMAVKFKCDILMGTMYYDSVHNFCKEHSLKYMPFVGQVTGRPSILEGTVEGMIKEANSYLKKGVYGFDLLAYRYTGDVSMLIKEFVSQVEAPVCLAGSVNSYKRLDEVKSAAPWAFTIGSAFFENKFGENFCEQIDNVCRYIE